MDEVWIRMFKGWLKSYEAIETLAGENMLEDDEYLSLRGKLLNDIIVTVESEVNE